jgi:hypothetical protein
LLVDRCPTSFLVRTVSPSEENSSQVTRKWFEYKTTVSAQINTEMFFGDSIGSLE